MRGLFLPTRNTGQEATIKSNLTRELCAAYAESLFTYAWQGSPPQTHRSNMRAYARLTRSLVLLTRVRPHILGAQWRFGPKKELQGALVRDKLTLVDASPAGSSETTEPSRWAGSQHHASPVSGVAILATEQKKRPNGGPHGGTLGPAVVRV